MTGLLIKGGQVYDPRGFQREDLLLRQGVLIDRGPDLEAKPGVEVMDARGLHVLPGLADPHVHLREPGFSYKETVATGTAAAAKGGFTLVCAMPNLNPVPDDEAHLAMEEALIREQALIRVLPYASITKEQKGRELVDYAALASRCAGFSDDGFGVADPAILRRAMKGVKEAGSLIAAHCEDLTLVPQGAAIHQGAFAAARGWPGIPSASEYQQVRRDLALVEETGCPYHLCHLSTAQSVAALREAKAKGLPVSGETAPHYLAFCDEDLEDHGRFKMNPPLRSRADRQALLEGLADGTLDMIATDHAPHSAQEKGKGLKGSLMGVSGLEVSFAACYSYLCRRGVVDLVRLVDLLSNRPRKLLGLPWGIRLGEPADLTVVDLEKAFPVQGASFVSKGQATPFEGETLWGDILLTIYDGRTVYKRSEG